MIDILGKIGCKLAPVGVKVAAKMPEILLVGGIASIVGGTVVACKATLNVPEHICDKDTRIMNEIDSIPAPNNKDIARVKTAAYLELGAKMAKDYAVPALLIGGGIAMVVGGHNQLRSRLGALGAAYATLENAYSNYREKVIEDYGEEVDRRYRYGTVAEKIEETTVTKSGKEKTKTTVIETVHANGEGYSMYTRYFDAYNSDQHTNNLEYNKDFLILQQNAANEMLQRRGYLFLNEVYDMLGFAAIPEGQLVGWIGSDKYVDFGLFEARNADCIDFVNSNNNGKDHIFVLDFNVDGVMWDLIGEPAC